MGTKMGIFNFIIHFYNTLKDSSLSVTSSALKMKQLHVINIWLPSLTKAEKTCATVTVKHAAYTSVSNK